MQIDGLTPAEPLGYVVLPVAKCGRGRPAVTDSASAPIRAGQTRLTKFREAYPGVEVVPGPGFWEADYRARDGRMAYKARYELPVLLDDLERELRDE